MNDGKPTEAEIDAEIRKWIAGQPSRLTVKVKKERAPEPEPELPEGYEWEDGPDEIPKPRTPELQRIIDDARSAGYTIHDHGEEAYVEILKFRDGKCPTGLSITCEHIAHPFDYTAGYPEKITDYAVMRQVLKLEP
jgi:hypothetical protein